MINSEGVFIVPSFTNINMQHPNLFIRTAGGMYSTQGNNFVYKRVVIPKEAVKSGVSNPSLP